MHKVLFFEHVESFAHLGRNDFVGSAANVLHSILDRSPVEKFVVLYVNSKAEVTGSEVVAVGDLEMVQVGVRNMFRGAILHTAPRIVLGHNHPHGDPTASQPDWLLTDAAMLCSELLKIQVMDHIIVSPNGKHYSCFEHVQDFQRMMQDAALRAQAQQVINNLIPSANKGPMGIDMNTLKKIMGIF